MSAGGLATGRARQTLGTLVFLRGIPEVPLAVRRLAISIPEDVLVRVDEAARRARLSRSAYITRVLSRVTRARSDAEITRRINALLAADEGMIAEDRATARAFLLARADQGTEW